MPTLEFLRSQHPIYTKFHDEWERRERLFRGGIDVIEEELSRFEWEESSGDSYAMRRNQAVYPAFGEAFAKTLVGHVMRERPAEGTGLQMGALGTVARSESQSGPSEAELVFYNINGTGGDGQQLWQWTAAVFERACATGLRWVLIEAPTWSRTGTPTGADMLAGQRPYAVEFSPRQVTNWEIDRGTLMWCVVKLRHDTRRMVDGQWQGAANEEAFYLLVRKGTTKLGTEYQGGGWWKFDKDGNAIPNEQGDWSKVAGEIPMALAIWEWEMNPSDEDPLPLARSGTTGLDNLSVGYMNLKSAWRSNGWRTAGAPDYLLGVDPTAWDKVKEQYESGSSVVGVPMGREGNVPQLAHGSAGLVAAETFRALLDDMTAEAERMMVQQATATPDSSGRSKEAGFTEAKAPRLVMLAENVESFLNTALRFFELRFGHQKPSAYVQMPREFDLAPVEDDIRDFFDTFRRSELRSATLESEAMVRLAEAKGLVGDDNREAVLAELVESARASITAATQERGLFGDLFRGARTEPEDEGGEE